MYYYLGDILIGGLRGFQNVDKCDMGYLVSTWSIEKIRAKNALKRGHVVDPKGGL